MKERWQRTMMLRLYECSNELCQAIINWIVGNRKAHSKIEIENFSRRLTKIRRKVGLALEKSKIDECFKELIIVRKELETLLMEIRKYQTIERLENDIEECFTKFTEILNDYH